MYSRLRFLLLLPLMAFLTLACGGGGGGTSNPELKPPVISTFTVAPPTIAAAQDVDLSWSVSGAAGLQIDPGAIKVTGTGTMVHATATTTYTLTATNADGTDSAQATVTLTPPGSKPVITAFSASPSTITTSPQSVVLSWTVSGANSFKITPGIGTVTGTSRGVNVTGTTTYTLTATNTNGDTTASTKVTYAPAGTVKIAYLHHSTGGCIWGGGVPGYFTSYNSAHGTNYQITQWDYPNTPYPWANYPYDYWNLWVNPNGPVDDGNPNVYSLTKLCADYDVIVFKHCFPVSSVGPDSDCNPPSVSSQTKTIANYKLQYNALKARMLQQFPTKKFIVWTGAALRKSDTTLEQAQRAKQFFDWVKNTWDVKGDNIFVWDFWSLETAGSADGGIYLNDAYSAGDSHPNAPFSSTVAPYIGKRIVDVIEGRGDTGSITGQ